MSSIESRTFLLERQLVESLASSDLSVFMEAASQLPEALTRKEISDVGIQVSLIPGAQAVHQGEKLEKQAIFHLGLMAIVRGEDLVTAENASREMLSRGDIVGWFMLASRSRKAKKQIIKEIEDLT